jgi:membrane protease YdiL (CAAX protease family)
MDPIRRYPTVAFFALAYAIAWLAWGTDLALGGAAQGLITIGSFGPLLAALIVTGSTEGRGAVRTFLGRLRRWRGGGRLYALALIGPFLLALGAALLDTLTGGPAPSFARQIPADLPPTALLLLPLIFLFGLLFGGPLGEEPGWRGFALPRFLAGFGPWTASTILGLAWGLWHIPLFEIPGTTQSAIPLGAFVFWTIGLSYLFTRLYQASDGSLPLMIIFHTAINFFAGLLVLPAGNLLSVRPFLFHMGLVWLACIVLTMTTRFGRKETPRGADRATDHPDGMEAAP